MAVKKATARQAAIKQAAAAATASASESHHSSGIDFKGHVRQRSVDLKSDIHDLAGSYKESTSLQTKIIDGFLVYLVGLGIWQFIHVLLVGTFPFNAFLGGFSAAIGQFVLTAALRMQTQPGNKSQFPLVSPERSFGDYIFASLVLHFFVYNFIN